MPAPAFAGARACGACHQSEFKLWIGSHHQLAMQPVSAATVLGDFNHASFINGKVMTTFFHDKSKFMVRTEGADGRLHDYQIKFTFGVYPLQQYLIEMPRGRLQALAIGWDSRSRDRGGQHWFSLYPGQSIAHRDRLHWTGIDQNWNYMCADCHSTNVRKNYDLKTRTFATTYSEIDVGCEACHGPGSNHLAWAKQRVESKKAAVNEGLTITFDQHKSAAWLIASASGKPHRIEPLAIDREIQMCARCHSRRGQIHEDYVHGQAVDDDYRIALLDDDLYFPDGQIKSEDYEYGSFIQSRMFQAGVTCSDCHDPHSLQLRAQGNNVCLQCHSAQKYDSPKHHFHATGSTGSQCINCHMPARTYMVIDVRRDHSLRVPRPDLSAALGTPNACNSCHTDKASRWASDYVDKWYGHQREGLQRFVLALSAGSQGAPGARQSLRALVTDSEQPAIARATAISRLANYDLAPDDPALRAALADKSPLVRQAAVQALSDLSVAGAADKIVPLLCDGMRAVRIEAASSLAGMPIEPLPGSDAAAFAKARAEYIAAQELNADRPEAHLNLALLFVRERQFHRAEDELRNALSLDPSFAPAAVNLADLYREVGREADGEAVLRTALLRSPADASLLHALGLSMVRQQQNAKALDLLAAAARLDPVNPRYSYVYAIALADSGQTPAAIAILKGSLAAHPYDHDLLAALTSLCTKIGDRAEALTYARRLYELDSGNPR